MIRKAKKSDISGIIHYAKCLFDNFESTYDINSYISDDKYLVLVSSDEELNGFLIAYNNIDEIELLTIVVDQDKRNNQIGSSLMEELIKLSDKPIILEVASNNIAAIKLYEKYDFKQIGERKNYYNDIAAIIMRR